MKITKLGHCCLLIEIKGKTILTDPGSYTIEAHSKLTKIDFVLFSHEHADHYHLDSLRVLLGNNPGVMVYANVTVGDLLDQENIPYTLVEHGSEMVLGNEISLKGFGEMHAVIHSSLPLMRNTGFFVDERLWYPGDAFTPIDKDVEILALPVAGPWMKISEAVDYALSLKPKTSFPVHDGVRIPSTNKWVGQILSAHNVEFTPLEEGESKEFY